MAINLKQYSINCFGQVRLKRRVVLVLRFPVMTCSNLRVWSMRVHMHCCIVWRVGDWLLTSIGHGVPDLVHYPSLQALPSSAIARPESLSVPESHTEYTSEDADRGAEAPRHRQPANRTTGCGAQSRDNASGRVSAFVWFVYFSRPTRHPRTALQSSINQASTSARHGELYYLVVWSLELAFSILQKIALSRRCDSSHRGRPPVRPAASRVISPN